MSFVDPFDTVMNATCDIYEKGAGETNAYGQADQTLTLMLSNWPCRLSIKGGDHKYMKGKEFAVHRHVLFMRPPTQDNNGNPFELNEHHWCIVSTPDGRAQLKLNIQGVDDPSGIGHHLQVEAEQVIP